MSIRDNHQDYLDYMKKYNYDNRIKLRKQYKQWRKEHIKERQLYLKQWHSKNAHKVSYRNSVINKRNKEYIKEIKLKTPCFDCNIIYPPVCMDFDHLNKQTKLGNISQMAQQHLPLELIKLEIAKCQLVCSNCHRLRTQKRGQFKWG